MLSIITVFNLHVSGSKRHVDFEETKIPTYLEDSFQQTLIYNGKIGSKINVGYREFLRDMARPAFSNNAEYDLSTSKVIGYKGAQVEVIEATNQLIRYKVIKNFNTPQMGIGVPALGGSQATESYSEPIESLASGTGFAVSGSGHIVTNYHVIEDAYQITVILKNAGSYSAQVLRTDKANDLALLKIESETKPLTINLSATPKKGEEVLALGYPRIDTQGNELKATTGRINSMTGIDNDHRFLQIDASIQPGNSGGPLLTHSGELIGVVTGTLSPLLQLVQDGSIPQNVNYSMKVDYLIPLIKDLPLLPAEEENLETSLVDLIAKAEKSVVVVMSRRLSDS